MALIKCSECGRDVSDSASSCPNCGHPISQINGNSVQTDSAPRKIKKYRVGFLIFVPMFFVGAVLALAWWLSGSDGQFGFGIFIAGVGFVGMIISAIMSWLSKP